MGMSAYVLDVIGQCLLDFMILEQHLCGPVLRFSCEPLSDGVKDTGNGRDGRNAFKSHLLSYWACSLTSKGNEGV